MLVIWRWASGSKHAAFAFAFAFTLNTTRPASSRYITRKICSLVPSFSPFAPQPDLLAINKRITRLIRDGRLEDARTLFDQLMCRNTVTWNSMISGYVRCREIGKARKLFDYMPQRDVVSWNLMISGYVSCRGKGFLEEGRHLFDQMPERDFISWNTMITGYARNNQMDRAFGLFDSMPEKNVVTWNAMISGFLENGDVNSAISFFEKMPEQNEASLCALVSGLIQNGKLDEAAKVLLKFGKMDEGRVDLVCAYNTLIAGYAQKGKVAEARNLFDQIPFFIYKQVGENKRFKRNVVSWNSMIMGYVKVGDIVAARKLFDQMVDRDSFSWNTMISGYAHNLDMEEASKLFASMPDPDALSWNSLISGYAQMGKLEAARDLFERMPHKNRISWNSMIAGCQKNRDYEGAIELFIQMQVHSEKPDRHTLSSILSVCAESVHLQLGMQIHQLVTKTIVPDVPLNNSLITMYARGGAIFEARIVFDQMGFRKDVISWNSMIAGYAYHGYASLALDLFESMKRLKLKPTHITFILVLHACAHAGLVEQGRAHFKAMVGEFGIEPRVEHFASLVDVVGRQGHVEEAMDIVKSMSMEPDKAVWGAMLGACRVHNSVELARVAAEALMKLEPESSGPYVLLYNMYVDVDRWDDAKEIRIMMEKNNIRKEAAYSRVNSSWS